MALHVPSDAYGVSLTSPGVFTGATSLHPLGGSPSTGEVLHPGLVCGIQHVSCGCQAQHCGCPAGGATRSGPQRSPTVCPREVHSPLGGVVRLLSPGSQGSSGAGGRVLFPPGARQENALVGEVTKTHFKKDTSTYTNWKITTVSRFILH